MALVRVKVHLPNPEDDVLTYAEDRQTIWFPFTSECICVTGSYM